MSRDTQIKYRPQSQNIEQFPSKLAFLAMPSFAVIVPKFQQLPSYSENQNLQLLFQNSNNYYHIQKTKIISIIKIQQ